MMVEIGPNLLELIKDILFTVFLYGVLFFIYKTMKQIMDNT